MKTNIITNNTIMRNVFKYLCAVLLVIGTSAHAWATASIAEGRYDLVTDPSTLNTSDSYIIAGSKSGLWAMQPYSSGNNCSCVKVLNSFVTGTPEESITLDGSEGVAEFTLSGSASGWSIFDGQNYYYTDGAATSGQNYLKGSDNGSVANHLWTITSPGGGSSPGQVYVHNTTNTNVPYMHLSDNSTPKMACYNGSGKVYIYKKIPSVTLHDGVGGASTSTIAIGAYFPNEAAEVPGWAFMGYWATSADQNCQPNYPSGPDYNAGDQAAAGTYYAIYQGQVYGCNYGIYSCKPTAIYVLSQTNPSSGVGVNLVVPDIGCGEVGTTITLTLYINEPGTSYQGATIVRDDNGQAVSFIYDDSGADPIITFDLPASDVTATVNFECPDIHSSTVTIPTITPVYNTSTSKWEATAAWNAVDGATNYKVQLGNRTTTTVLTSPNPTVVTTTSYTNDAVLKNLTVDNEYRLMVQAYNSCDAEHPTAYSQQDFTPHCAELEGTLAIALDEVGSTTANLSWSGATTPAIQTTSGANSSLKYDVQITRTLPLPAGATGGVLDASDVTYTAWEGTDLTTGATYQIDVTAKNACGETMAASRTFKCKAYEDYLFTCADLSLTDEDGTHAPIWITSTAGKMVRSQKALHIEGTGLKPNGAFTFTIGGVAANNCASGDVFAIRQADGSAVAADASGNIDMDVYVFYQPSVATDGLDLNAVGTAIVATSAEGTVPPADREYKAMSATLANVAINGRHLPTTGYVIAGKKNNKWYALPSNMASTTNPKPSEIAVDDINNPSIAYTATSNIYSMEGPTASNISGGNGQYIRLTMSIDDGTLDPHAAPLFGSATGTRTIGKSGNSQASSDLSAGWWWSLTQTNTSITNPQDAKYTIKCANNTSTLSLRDNAGDPDWGLFASGVEELRLIPASDIIFAEAEVVEWGQHAAIIEVDATAATGIDATSVIAHLNGASSAAITLVETRASDAKNRSSKYNYTVNFGDGIDFAADASNGAMLTLEWKKDAAVKAMSNIVVPKIVATSATMSSLIATDDPWNSADVHVLPGVTLTANAGDFSSKDVVVDRLEIYPGATVKVTKGSQDVGTLKVRSLVLRNGWTRVSGKNYDVARLYVSTDANLAKNAVDNIWYSDWYIDYDQYYPIAIPFPVATNRITYKNTKSAATGGVTIRYYDGARRAEHEQQDQADNWVAYTWGGTMPENLAPSTGYAMTARRPSGKAFSIVRMPMTFSNPWTALGEHGYVGETHKDQVTVTGYGKDTAPWYAMGWNFIGNPYMCTFNGNDGGISGKITIQEGGNVKYATIPDLEFKNYYQVPIAEANLKPASGFFIQADNASPQTITFNADKIVPPSAPVRYTVQQERIPEQEAYIRLSYDGGNDLMGLIIGEDYTEGYEPNADLAKVLGGANAVKTYMHYADMDMAYVAINETLAKEWIPVTVNIPADGEYTYSLTSYSEVNDLEGVYLIDYMNSNQVTNLIEEDYTFVAEAGTSANRFSINAKVGQRNTPTDIDIINAGGDINSSKPLKFLWNDKVFILHNGVIYDATGKKVREINK